jgi:selenocysteine lyase/cysteine desulfurase
LNNAGLAPISLRAKETIEYWARRFFEEGFATDHDYMEAVRQTRVSLAQLIGCDWDEIAFYQSTAGGINQVAMQMGLKAQDEVLMWDQEYSSHLYPWQQACLQSGAKLRLVESDPSTLETPTEKYLSTINDKTRVVAFSWMQFQSGSQMDYPQVIQYAKQKGIFVFVDVMQGLGIIPCDLWSLGVDAVAGGSHKWLVSPVGVGYLAIRKKLALTMKPQTYGSSTFGTCDDPSDFECRPKTDATKFEAGSKQVLEITALGSSVDLILETGVQNLLDESMRLKNLLLEQLDVLGFKYLKNAQSFNPIVNLSCKNLNTLIDQLKSHHILHAKRGPGVRIAFHAFNTDQDLDKLIEVLKKV